MITAETEVRALLSKMAADVDTIMSDSRLTDRLRCDFPIASLSDILQSLSPRVREITKIYAKQRLNKMHNKFTGIPVIFSEELRLAAIEFTVWAFVQTHSSELPPCLPKLHHWLPLCYTKNFATHILTHSRHGARLNSMIFNVDGSVAESVVVRDSIFTHKKSDNGYYPQHIEQFFSCIERNYGAVTNTVNSKRNAWTSIVLYAFFAVQSARNPDPRAAHTKSMFSSDHRDQIIPTILTAFDIYKTPYVQYARGCNNLRFSPFFPPRVRITVDGTRASVFPLTTCTAVVVTDREIDRNEACRITARNAESLVRYSARHIQPLFGIR